jgi:hypothetical protein
MTGEMTGITGGATGLTRARRRIPAAVAGLALVAVTAAACGSDDGSGATASDPTGSTTTSAAPTPTETPAASETPTASDAPTESDPVPSPIITKAVKAALKAGFPALIPAGVPDGWTVVSASYAPKGGGTWTIELTDPNGAPATLLQSTASAADLVARLLPGAKAGGTVKISGTGKWDAYTGSGGAGIAKDLPGTGAALVGADLNVVSDFAHQLLTAEDAGNGNGG